MIDNFLHKCRIPASGDELFVDKPYLNDNDSIS